MQSKRPDPFDVSDQEYVSGELFPFFANRLLNVNRPGFREHLRRLDLEPDADEAIHVAGLPTELESEAEKAKRFDLLILNLQLAVLRAEPAFERLVEQVKAIAGLLEEKSAIPMVHEQMALIQDLQTDEWWENVASPMLEAVRRRLRSLVRLIEKHKRKPIYKDFKDEMGTATEVKLPGFAPADQWQKFRAKVRAFLMSHQELVAVHKLRTNQPLIRHPQCPVINRLTCCRLWSCSLSGTGRRTGQSPAAMRRRSTAGDRHGT